MSNDELPPDPFPQVDVKVIDMDEIALLVMVAKDGHLTFRSSVSRDYAKYALRTALERLEAMGDG